MHAETVVVGATVMEGNEPTQRQLLAAMPTDLPGVSMPEPFRLVGVAASHTGSVRLERVFVEEGCLLAGPAEDVMRKGFGAGTGGYETSTLAVGLSDAALTYLEDEASKRPDLDLPLDSLRREYRSLRRDLLAIAGGDPATSPDDLRRRANSLVLRASQAALAAAKGAGYVVGHPTGRWCREALFFLVWSCPQSVLSANLCELAGVA
jgi:alkylation response protein AidB-like acyl-CoA dehydrogenase